MSKFGTILNHYKDNINNHFWYDKINFTMVWNKPRITCIKWTMRSWISINDLLSPNSWFIQACKWKDNGDYLALNPYVTNLYNDWSMVEQDKSFYWCEYHSMMLSILPDEEKIKYLTNNIIIDD